MHICLDGFRELCIQTLSKDAFGKIALKPIFFFLHIHVKDGGAEHPFLACLLRIKYNFDIECKI